MATTCFTPLQKHSAGSRWRYAFCCWKVDPADQLGPVVVLRHTGPWFVRILIMDFPQQHQRFSHTCGKSKSARKRLAIYRTQGIRLVSAHLEGSGIMHSNSSDKSFEPGARVFAQRELGSREGFNREHWSAISEEELVYPVILMLLADIKRALVSLAGKQPNDIPYQGGTCPSQQVRSDECVRIRQ